MHSNYSTDIEMSNIVYEDFEKLIQESRYCDGNPADENLIQAVRKFSENFKNSKQISIGVVKCIITLNLPKEDIIWFSQCLPIFKSQGHISEEQCLRVSDIISRMID